MGDPLRPIGDRVLIRPEKNPEQTESGLHLVDHAKPATAGTVVSIGLAEHPLRTEAARWAGLLPPKAGALLLAATQRVPEVKPGDYVLFSWQSGQELWIDDEQLVIMRESDILAVVDEE